MATIKSEDRTRYGGQLTPCRWYSLYLRTSSWCWLGGSQLTRMEKAEVGRAVRLLGGPGSSTSCCVRTNTSGDEEPGPCGCGGKY